MITYPTIATPARPALMKSIFSRHAGVIALVLWTFVPLLRRLVQWPTSYGAGNALTLLPPMFAIAAVIHEWRRIKCTRLVTISIVATAVSFIYAFVISVFANNWLSGLYAFIDFTIPFAAATLVLRTPESASAEDDVNRYFVYLRCVAYTTLIVSAYGILQYLNPLPWDTKWMTDSAMNSIGNPRPFEVRVFSVLNSPGILGSFLAIAILHLLPLAKRSPRLAYSALILSLATSALSLLRAGWVALALGLVVYVVFSVNRLTFFKILTITSLIVFATFQILQNTPGLESVTNVLTQRFNTLTDVEHDVSAISREDQIQQAINLTRLNPIGYGLGVYGNSTSLSSIDGSPGIIDSGYLARSVEMGWIGFVLYLAPFVLFTLYLLSSKLTVIGTGIRNDSETDHIALAAGCLAALFALNAFGDVDRGVIEYLGFAALFFAASLQSRYTSYTSHRPDLQSDSFPGDQNIRLARAVNETDYAGI